MPSRKCYICGTALKKNDENLWKKPYHDKLCPRCIALVEGQRATGAMMRRCTGYPSRPDRLRERRDMRAEARKKPPAKKPATSPIKKTKGKQKKAAAKPPEDPKPVDQKGKGPQVPASVVLCSTCGHPNQVAIKTTAKKITAKCDKCGALIEISGALLGKMRVDRDAVKLIEQLAIKPGGLDPKKKGKATSGGDKADAQFMTMNFRVTHEQRDVIRLAMEVMRRDNESLQGKGWHGTALERLAAEYIGGAPKAILKAVREELEKAGKIAEGQGLN